MLRECSNSCSTSSCRPAGARDMVTTAAVQRTAKHLESCNSTLYWQWLLSTTSALLPVLLLLTMAAAAEYCFTCACQALAGPKADNLLLQQQQQQAHQIGPSGSFQICLRQAMRQRCLTPSATWCQQARTAGNMHIITKQQSADTSTGTGP